MKKIELLAPVGSHEAFISSINNGADAIYLAGEHFGAREKATFTNDELKEMIKYAHIREVRVHVVINTLIYDDEIDRVMEFVDFLYNNDVDAVIVQDLGIITLIHKTYPDLEIHASTQLNTLNYKQAQVLKDLGVSRVILAREANLDVVKEIKEKVNIDVEIFAHGALCMGYSGQCLFSSLAAKKSGNRGECLQLCRLPYSFMINDKRAISDGEYLLSCKDLCTLEYIDDFIEAGVTSLKIEGRVKSASYVGKTVSMYRKYIDEFYSTNKINVDKNDILDLKKVFNRDFTKGYIKDEKARDIVNHFRPNNIGVKIGRVVKIDNNKVYVKLTQQLYQGDGVRFISDHGDTGMFVNKLYNKGLLTNVGEANEIIGIELKNRVNIGDIVYKTSDIILNKQIEENNTKCVKRFPIDVKVEAYIGKNLVIEAIDNLNNKVRVKSEYVIDKANNTPTSKERIKEQINKLRESVYYLNQFDIEGDEMIIIPISIINRLRNEMIDCLNKKREIINTRKGKQISEFENIEIVCDDFSYMYKINNKDQYEIIKEYENDKNIYWFNKECVYPYFRISNGLISPKNNSVLVNELSDIDTTKYMIANTYMNTTNIYALYTLYKLGFKRVTLSVEMGLERIKNLINNYKKVFGFVPNVEVIVYGKTDLMITKHCPINNILKDSDIDCGRCKGDRFYLLDRKGYKLELLKDGLCNIRIINPKRLHLIEYVDILKEIGVSKVRLEFTSEDKEEIREIYLGYKNKSLDLLSVTRGYFSELED